MNIQQRGPWVGQAVTMAFRTIHRDRAGETSSNYVAQAEIADLRDAESALLITAHGTPMTVPVEKLYAAESAALTAEAAVWQCGHELIRSFHPSGSEARTQVRWLASQEVSDLLQQ